ncbi:hypothetical protein JKG68_10695 [Microvirga aerilata]|uniref:Uncharacterized protein n=1 Tax=Microvirga aerilata TaxID=670292 RepID=A0A936Z770_9HYPH|nr:hypothetical protein [Microvirga aerilata]MBL0404436.1 hypothetical protein [Microvirga aerilata]
MNDPGAWGSATPRVLILGFSKGFTQAGAYRTSRFEDVPFKNMRTRLTESLRLLGVLGSAEEVDDRMVASETDFAFGSLVRCSLARQNEGTGRLECTGPIMPKAFTEDVALLVRRCAETFLLDLPRSVRLVLMLGTGNAYIEGCRGLVRSLYGPRFAPVNDVSYRTGDVIWVHISHPSGLNGHHLAWMAGGPSTPQGHKQRLACEAVRLAGAPPDISMSESASEPVVPLHQAPRRTREDSSPKRANSSMKFFIIERIRPDGERYIPYRYEDGLYRVADPSLGRTKHLAANQIAIREDEIVPYLQRGFPLRMIGERTGQRNLIAAADITVRSSSDATSIAKLTSLRQDSDHTPNITD